MFESAMQLFLQLFCCWAVGFGQARTDATPGGLAAEDWAGIRAVHEESVHGAYALEGGGYEARNPGQQWRSSFDGRGFSVLPDAGGWTWGLELESYGFAGSEQEVTTPARTTAEGGRVTYEWNEALEEWYFNDTRGLEHGFTLAERPAAHQRESANPLTLTFSVRGSLRPEVDADTRGVRFLDGSGGTVLTYRGLLVVDADGQELQAGFRRVGDKLLLSIDERNARYPLTIDPLVQQQAYLKASNTGYGHVFGFSVSISGDTVVVGAPSEGSNATGVNGDQHNYLAPFSGAAYVFARSGATWIQQAYLKASNTGSRDWFGLSVSVSGDTIVVGAHGEASKATGVNGDQTDNSHPYTGAAYIFVRNGSTWSQQAYLKARNSGRRDHFGMSVAVSGDTVVVGAPRENSDATGVNGDGGNNRALDSGAAYVFVRSGMSWSQQAYLKASNTEAGDDFSGFHTGSDLIGGGVAVSGDTVVVGAPREDSSATGMNGNQSDNSAVDAGAAYVFVRTATTWSQFAYLKASNTDAGDEFGVSVSTSGDTIVVAAPREASSAKGVNGNQNDNSAFRSGAVYVFVRNGTGFSQEAYLKASNTEGYDQFGTSVSISGDTVVVGAPFEQSGATEVNGNQNDNNYIERGAGYLFLRSGTTWSQQAYLKPSNNTYFGERFGGSLSVADGTVVVGAIGERSNATGVNGNQNDSSLPYAGAAYVFEAPSSRVFTYCTGKRTSAGCVPFVSFSGTPSASAGSFYVLSNNHIKQNVVYLYSVNKADLGYHGSKLCVKAPFHRVTTSIAGVHCTTCTGCYSFKRDFNELIQSGTDPMLTAGQQVYVQVRQSDPANLGPTGFADNLSNALAFTIGP